MAFGQRGGPVRCSESLPRFTGFTSRCLMVNSSRAFAALLISAAFTAPCCAQRLIPLPPLPRPVVPLLLPHNTRHGDTQSDLNPTTTWVVAVILVGVVAVVGLRLGYAAWRRRTVAHLYIVRTPPGEAPEPVRRAWVGVKLPLRRGETEPVLYQTVGVLSKGLPEMAKGYAVDGRAAIQALAAHSLQAAAWWREHAPHVLERGYRLWFPSQVCDCVGSALGGQHSRYATTPGKFVHPWAESLLPPVRAVVLGLGADGRGGMWLREIPVWETFEPTTCDAQAEQSAAADRAGITVRRGSSSPSRPGC